MHTRPTCLHGPTGNRTRPKPAPAHLQRRTKGRRAGGKAKRTFKGGRVRRSVKMVLRAALALAAAAAAAHAQGGIGVPPTLGDCALETLYARVAALNAQCCSFVNGVAPPGSSCTCDIECSSMLLPLLDNCRPLLDALLDMDDGVRDGVTGQLTALREECLAIPELDVLSRLKEMNEAGTCSAEALNGMALTPVTAAPCADSGQVECGALILAGLRCKDATMVADCALTCGQCNGHRRAQITSRCTGFDDQAVVVNTACCDYDGCNGVPTTCDAKCAITYIDFFERCSRQLEDAIDPHQYPAWADLHSTCATQLPVEPLLRAVIACQGVDPEPEPEPYSDPSGDCSTIPCQNGGTCADSATDITLAAGTYSCTCPTGFSGQPTAFGVNCETTEDLCNTVGFGQPVPVARCLSQPGTTCVDCARFTPPPPGVYGQGTANPDCAMGYTCETAAATPAAEPAPEPAAVACADDPVCAGYADTFTQGADAGMGGCETWAAGVMSAVSVQLVPPLPAGQTLNELCPVSCHSSSCAGGVAPPPPASVTGCSTNPCQNAGSCTDLSVTDGTYSCTCAISQLTQQPTAFGVNCETTEDDCHIDQEPCQTQQPGSTCVDCARNLPASSAFGQPTPNPDCPLGYTCSCSGNTHSTDGLTCEACGAGKHPHADKSTCDDCPSDQAGKNGLCSTCDAGKQPNGAKTMCIGCGMDKYSADGSPCQSCPDGQTVNADKTDCDGR